MERMSDDDAVALLRTALQSGAIRLSQGVNQVTSNAAAVADATYILTLLRELTKPTKL